MATKLLLIKDVEDLGRSGDVVAVKPGFARNYLLPKGFGVAADKNALRQQARLQEDRKKKALAEREESEQVAGKLEGITIETLVKVDHEGNMYGSVSTADIVNLIQEQMGIHLEKRSITLKHALKEIGVHPIAIKLKEGVSSEITLKIIPEKEENGEKEAAQEKE